MSTDPTELVEGEVSGGSSEEDVSGGDEEDTGEPESNDAEQAVPNDTNTGTGSE